MTNNLREKLEAKRDAERIKELEEELKWLQDTVNRYTVPGEVDTQDSVIKVIKDQQSRITALLEIIKKQDEGLQFYTDLQAEYLEAGGLFNPELMQLRGEKLRALFNKARETREHTAAELEKLGVKL